MASPAPFAPRITMETSAVDTPARDATSASVGRFPLGTAEVAGNLSSLVGVVSYGVDYRTF
ncbi:hypothetical protein GCM10022232_89230 [Streptomyces plumbiresistens]|uniref:Uncharacterized protein n=1 Tax=Streptomyces plumbiresistens TaxID=511811 RepID=A0ABP7TQ03_9ACTN